ncbi:MAG: UDP-N-acetylglucosamine 2-epimerase (hydrolyzing), partial [Candidatus Latescibacteria bacterium]|nr:UDP-N-acetylglucosamine 2-epimerase (hydrolyzing) [Candidatus Latescibacterota bacterium]
QAIDTYLGAHPEARALKNMGTQGYFSLMSFSAAMVGNSSSGILEAASFKLPVVNIGTRQRGRVHGPNVIDVGYRREEVMVGVQTALSAEFRTGLSQLTNMYGDGHAAGRIVEVLRAVHLDDRLLIKRFYEILEGRPA